MWCLFAGFLGPNPVLNLVASPISTSSLEVQWSYPQEARSHYKYLVSVANNETTVDTNHTKIQNLSAGTKYRIVVKTTTLDSESTEEETYASTSKT